MTTYVLEMRSTQDWQDVRYRSFTVSKAKADRFRNVPRIQFTNSGHGIAPHVTEHKRGTPRGPEIWILGDHVREHMGKV